MNKKVFPLAGLLFLVLGLICLILTAILIPFTSYTFTSQKIPLKRIPACGGGCGGPMNDIGNTEYFWLNVQDERPLYITLHGSNTISVALATNVFGNSPTPTPITSNYHIDTYQSSYQGNNDNCFRCTPDTQFGPDYTAFAFAQIASPAFGIQMLGDAEQRVNTPILYWDWNILANEPGSQVVNLLVELRWKKAGVTVQTAKVLRQFFTIQVTQPLLTLNPLSMGTFFSGVISAALGTGLTIPFVLRKREKRVRNKNSLSS